MPNPHWKVKETREDLIPGRISVVYELDDGNCYTTHFPKEMGEEECESTMDDTWLNRSNSSEAQAERVRLGRIPKLKKEHFPPGKVSKEARGGGNNQPTDTQPTP